MKHVFYLYSNLHYNISQEIIRSKRLDINDVILITQRKVLIDNSYKKKHINGIESSPGFKDRLFNLYKFKNDFKFLNEYIIVYVPFRWLKPYSFYDEIIFFEEGIACYTKSPIKYKFKTKLKDILIASIIFTLSELLLISKSKNFKSYFRGEIFFHRKTKFNNRKKYYGILQKPNLDGIKNIEVEYLKLTHRRDIEFNKFKNCNFLVLDSLFNNNFKLESLKKSLKLFQKKLNKNKIYIQFHPTDKLYPELIDKQIRLFNEFGLTYEVVDLNLDNLIKNKLYLNIYGFTSTLLFYVDKYETNNKSYSLSKKLYKYDEKYRKYLENWGGEEYFKLLTNNNVEIV